MAQEVEQTRGIACPNCGHSNPDGWLVCGSCHAALHALTPADPALLGLSDEPKPGRSHHGHHRITHRFALASLAFGVVGIFAPSGILAIILGHTAQIQIRKNRDRYRGRDVAKLGAILGYVGVLIFAVLFFGFRNASLFARPRTEAQQTRKASPADEQYDPYYRAIRSRPALSLSDRENKGVTLLKALQQAQNNYKAAHPAAGYTCALENLFESGFDPGMVQLSIDTGYTISITGCSPNTKGVHESYRALATPPPGAGNLLCTDDKGVIRSTSSDSETFCFENGKPVAIQ